MCAPVRCQPWAAPWVRCQELGASLVEERREAAGLSVFLLSECSSQPSPCEQFGRSSAICVKPDIQAEPGCSHSRKQSRFPSAECLLLRSSFLSSA